MTHLAVSIMAFLCVVASVATAEANPSDNAKVAGALRNLSALRSLRSNMVFRVQGHEVTKCTQRSHDPEIERTTVTFDYRPTVPTPIVVNIICTSGTTYVQDSETGVWTKKQPETAHEEMFGTEGDQTAELEASNYDYTYMGVVQLNHSPTLLYSFKRKSDRGADCDEGKIWIGEADNLPHRFECHLARTGPCSITFDNFNVPVSTELPSVEEEGPP